MHLQISDLLLVILIHIVEKQKKYTRMLCGKKSPIYSLNENQYFDLKEKAGHLVSCKYRPEMEIYAMRFLLIGTTSIHTQPLLEQVIIG